MTQRETMSPAQYARAAAAAARICPVPRGSVFEIQDAGQWARLGACRVLRDPEPDVQLEIMRTGQLPMVRQPSALTIVDADRRTRGYRIARRAEELDREWVVRLRLKNGVRIHYFGIVRVIERRITVTLSRNPFRTDEISRGRCKSRAGGTT